MQWLANVLRQNPELALFLSLALGYLLGKLRLGNFQVGAVLGTLIAGLLVGQFVIEIPNALKTVFFLMFMFATGYRTGPEFFRSLRSGALVQIGLIILFCVTALAAVWTATRFLDFNRGTAAGLLAGSQTNSTALGSATSAAQGLNIDAAAKASVTRDVGNAYALTYLVGVLLAVWFVPNMGPRLMRVNLRESCREYENKTDSGNADAVNSGIRELTVRAYRLPPVLAGTTVRDIETRWPADQRVVIPRIRRANAVVEATASTQLRAGDIVAAAGRSSAFVAGTNPLKEEVSDPVLLDVPTITADIVLTNRELAEQPLRVIAQRVGARGIFLVGLRRGGREMPFTPSTVVERGDVLNVTGSRTEVSRIADEVGYAVYPTATTNLLLIGAGVFVGGVIGIPAMTIGSISLSLSVPVGVLLAGLTLGYLRSINPRFGGIPDESVILLDSLGLSAFAGCVGLQSGPGVITAIRDSGGPLLFAAALTVLLPPIVTILVGYYIAHFPPGILLGLCAGAGTSGPTLAAVEKAADSKVPTLGYGIACAGGNILMAVWGTLLVLTGT